MAAAGEAWGSDWLEHSAGQRPDADGRDRPARRTRARAATSRRPPTRPSATRSGRPGSPASRARPRSRSRCDPRSPPAASGSRAPPSPTSAATTWSSVQDVLTPPGVPDPRPPRPRRARSLAAVARRRRRPRLPQPVGRPTSIPASSSSARPTWARTRSPSLDLGGDIGLLVDADLARGATEAELDLTAAGVPLGGSGREELERRGQGALTTLSVGNAEHLTAGEITGDLRLFGRRGRVLVEHEFAHRAGPQPLDDGLDRGRDRAAGRRPDLRPLPQRPAAGRTPPPAGAGRPRRGRVRSGRSA